MNATPFVEVGYGDTNINQLGLEKRWHRTVLQDRAMWAEYGCPFDMRETLPKKMYQAHQAILEGKAIKQEEQQKESERESRKAKRKAGKHR